MPSLDANIAYKAAEDVLEAFGTVSAPVPVEKIAKSLGIQVRFSPLDDELSGMIFIKDAIPFVGINAIHHPNRQRFTLAHEIGHYQLHRHILTSEIHVDKSFPILMRDPKSASGNERHEIEANQFAASLLMPRKLLVPALESKKFYDIDSDKPLEELAKKFRVSKQALEYRIRNIY